jgi:hypothetical protein
MQDKKATNPKAKPEASALPLDLIVAAARRTPDACAFLTMEEDGSASVTSYADLVRSVGRTANLFKALGAGDGAVAVVSDNTMEANVALLAAQTVSRALVMNPGVGPTLGEAIALGVKGMNIKVAVISASYPRAEAAALEAHFRRSGVVHVFSMGAGAVDSPGAPSLAVAAAAFADGLPEASPDIGATDVFAGRTQGLTDSPFPSLPRRIQAVMASCAWSSYGLEAGDIVLGRVGPASTAGCVYNLATLAAGGTIMIWHPSWTGPDAVSRSVLGATQGPTVETDDLLLEAVRRTTDVRTIHPTVSAELADVFTGAVGGDVRSMPGLAPEDGMLAMDVRKQFRSQWRRCLIPSFGPGPDKGRMPVD